jgi:hypothetical protein
MLKEDLQGRERVRRVSGGWVDGAQHRTYVHIGHFLTVESSSHLTIACSATGIHEKALASLNEEETNSWDGNELRLASAALLLPPIEVSLRPFQSSPGFLRLSSEKEELDGIGGGAGATAGGGVGAKWRSIS